MGAKVKGQGHKVTHEKNAQSAKNVVNATIFQGHNLVWRQTSL